jgi:hypothetical protein
MAVTASAMTGASRASGGELRPASSVYLDEADGGLVEVLFFVGGRFVRQEGLWKEFEHYESGARFWINERTRELVAGAAPPSEERPASGPGEHRRLLSDGDELQAHARAQPEPQPLSRGLATAGAGARAGEARALPQSQSSSPHSSSRALTPLRPTAATLGGVQPALVKMGRFRYVEVLAELISSEEALFRNLGAVVDVFGKQLRSAVGAPGGADRMGLSRDAVDLVLGASVEAVRATSARLLARLRAAQREELNSVPRVSHIFIECAGELLEGYARLARSHPAARQAVQRAGAAFTELWELFSKAKLRGEAQGETALAMLARPAQRVARLLVLLRDLRAASVHLDPPALQLLDRAVAAVAGVERGLAHLAAEAEAEAAAAAAARDAHAHRASHSSSRTPKDVEELASLLARQISPSSRAKLLKML